jgi:hypothetical protein
MRTEIVIPFAFDTAPIEKLLEEQGEAEVMRILSEKVDSAVIANLPMKNDGYGYNAKKVPDWRGFLENRFSRWLDEHTQEIIDEAALLMAAKGSRKKAWREVLAEVKADEGKQQE